MNEDQGTKLEKALAISDGILNDIENTDLPFEQILLKCKKLARLRDDFDALNWFTANCTGTAPVWKSRGLHVRIWKDTPKRLGGSPSVQTLKQSKKRESTGHLL